MTTVFKKKRLGNLLRRFCFLGVMERLYPIYTYKFFTSKESFLSNMKQNTLILVDTSGSMTPYFKSIKDLVYHISNSELEIKTINHKKSLTSFSSQLTRFRGRNLMPSLIRDVVFNHEDNKYQRVIVLTDLNLHKLGSLPLNVVQITPEEDSNLLKKKFSSELDCELPKSKSTPSQNIKLKESKSMDSEDSNIPFLIALIFIILFILPLSCLIYFSTPKEYSYSNKHLSQKQTKSIIKGNSSIQNTLHKNISTYNKKAQSNWAKTAESKTISLKIPEPKITRIKSTKTFLTKSSIELGYKIEGYPSGAYKVADSKSTLKALDETIGAISYQLNQYDTIHRLQLTLTGTADAVQFKQEYEYDGEDIQGVIYSFNGHASTLSITEGGTYKSNHILAFLRLYNIEQYLKANTLIRSTPRPPTVRNVQTHDGTTNIGEKFRSVHIEIEIKGYKETLQ